VRTPSVVQGRWREQRWSYNAQGQPTRVVQTGWVPALPKEAGSSTGEPQALKREVNYSYQRINNRSVLVAVDGPLPGADDTRRYVWDKRGDFVSSEELPLKLRRSLVRDATGRVVTSTDVDGVPVRLRYTPMGQALHWQRGEAEVRLTLDAQERPTRIELPDGEVQQLAYGGPQGQGSALAMSSNAGWARWLARPEPSVMPAPARVPMPEPMTTPEPAQSPPWADEQVIIDDFGRLVAMHTQTTGWELRSYDAQDQIVARHTSDGTDWRWQRDALGRITRHVVSRPGQAEQVTTLRYKGPWLIDVVHPHESEHLSYDALGRLSTRTVRRQQLSYTERLAYDAADRVTRHDLPEGGSLRYAWGVGR
ncbi:MAG TPA: RHS repeat domain-containing protein, partial [Aquabacterium sp.]|nr:RHS repeat domain-containing protein [Aquabacterium sp.]